MDYQKIYQNLIENPCTDGYTESHHIIPKCMGGTDSPENLVNLSARQHFIAHLLLVKIYPKNPKLVYAANMLSVGSSRSSERTSNRRYAWLREKLQQTLKTREFTTETRQRMSAGKKNQQKVSCPHCGKTGLVGNMNRWHFDNCKHKPGNEGKKHKFMGIPPTKPNTEIVKCPYCEYTGLKCVVATHSNYCNHNPNKKEMWKHPVIKCPHCDKEGIPSNMKRWHFDNCKFKPS